MSNPPDIITGELETPSKVTEKRSTRAGEEGADGGRKTSADLWLSGTEVPEHLARFTSEGAQEMFLEEDAGVLATQTGSAIDDDYEFDPFTDAEDRQIINLGPQHPATHGVLRLQVELEGETIVRSKPIIGYLHTGMERTAEYLTYMQGPTNVTRMDYLAPFHNELCFSLAVERLLGVEVPPRAQAIRVLMTELNRVSSHLLWAATHGMDLGAISIMMYGWRQREALLAFFEEVTGLRMNHNYIRPGGVAADLPDGWEASVEALLDEVPKGVNEFDSMLASNPIFLDRTKGVGILTADECLAYGVTGPMLRATGVDWDLRKAFPYSGIDQYEFDVPLGEHGDVYDRYTVRIAEIHQSLRIVRQVLETMPAGDYRTGDRKVTPPPRARIDQSMEALIHHFKIFTEGFKVPAGEVYEAIESPRGELGMYLVSNGGAKPWRLHVRGPSFASVQALPPMLAGGLIGDAVAALASADPVMGDVDR